MDPLQSLQIEDNTNKSNVLVVNSENGEVCIQLEGSHTTSTETEAANFKEKKNVKFEDETKEQQLKEEIDNSDYGEGNCRNIPSFDTQKEPKEVRITKEEYPMATEGNNVTNKEAKQSETKLEVCTEIEPAERSPSQSAAAESVANSKDLDKPPLEQHETKEAANENMEISLRFKQIMEMFDNFTKNLETLDLTSSQKPTATSSNEILCSKAKRKRPKSLLMKREQNLEEPQKHKSRYEEYFKEEHGKEDRQDLQPTKEPRSVSSSASSNELTARNRFEEYLKQQEMELISMEIDIQKRTENLKVRSISTATSNFELKTLGCQTVPHDHISLNDFSLMEVSSLSSRCEQPNSLNNYAQPENACLSANFPQQDNDKKPLIDSKHQNLPLIPPIITQEPSTAPAFNIITIEANATPSATELRRAPLCQRLWSVICDFCAATFLCLQVNRDCIFCLGFFAAFVVSASFLTAFFYHTLSVSPSLWQTPDNMRL
ncbi:GRIP and coiled-coil domain-containing protein 2 [Calliphora vicina]|uniref:GRIP and coiled-coil domain-containing protein 2 n=1 Tax=Calliphora vicina TaxID=7373 RepID=UPI00325B953B